MSGQAGKIHIYPPYIFQVQAEELAIVTLELTPLTNNDKVNDKVPEILRLA